MKYSMDTSSPNVADWKLLRYGELAGTAKPNPGEFDSAHLEFWQEIECLRAEVEKKARDIALYRSLLKAEQEDCRRLNAANNANWDRAEQAEAELTAARREGIREGMEMAATMAERWHRDDALPLCCDEAQDAACISIAAAICRAAEEVGNGG